MFILRGWRWRVSQCSLTERFIPHQDPGRTTDLFGPDTFQRRIYRGRGLLLNREVYLSCLHVLLFIWEKYSIYNYVSHLYIVFKANFPTFEREYISISFYKWEICSNQKSLLLYEKRILAVISPNSSFICLNISSIPAVFFFFFIKRFWQPE